MPRDVAVWGSFSFGNMMGLLIRVKAVRDTKWTHLNLSAIEDSRLSWKSKAIHTYLISRPPDWIVRERDLINRSSQGKDALRDGIKELEKFGYLVREKNRSSSGLFQTTYQIFDVPDQGGKTVAGKSAFIVSINSTHNHTSSSSKKKNQDAFDKASKTGRLKPFVDKYDCPGLNPETNKRSNGKLSIADRRRLRLETTKPKRREAEIVNRWRDIAINHRDGTQALGKGISCIRAIMKGKFFDDPGRSIYKDCSRPYTAKELLRALDEFDRRRNNLAYKPSNKRALQKLSLSSFFYNPHWVNGNGAAGHSVFLDCLASRSKLAADQNPELSEYIAKKFKSMTSGIMKPEVSTRVATKVIGYWKERQKWLKGHGVNSPKRVVVEWMEMLEKRRGQDWDVGLILSAKMDPAFEQYVRSQD